jgi:hypothetical protein
MTTQCLDVASLQPTPTSACPDASVTAATATISGNATFNADMTYSTTSAQTVTFYWHFPADCLNGQTCDYLASTGQAGLPAGVSFTCTGTTDCDCIESASGNSSDSGTYSVSGSNLLTNSTTNGAGTGLYCVQGSTLHLVTIDTTTNNGPGGGPTITRDIVGQKQ